MHLARHGALRQRFVAVGRGTGPHVPLVLRRLCLLKVNQNDCCRENDPDRTACRENPLVLSENPLLPTTREAMRRSFIVVDANPKRGSSETKFLCCLWPLFKNYVAIFSFPPLGWLDL